MMDGASQKRKGTPLQPTIQRNDSDSAAHNGALVTVAELARYYKISVDTVYRDIKKGALRAYRVGSSGAIRIRVDDARRYGRPNS